MNGDPRLTTSVTIARGEEKSGGWRDLVEGPGEDYQERVPKGEPLACLWHVSDVHLCDAESPARLEYLDRFGDPDSPYRAALGDIGTYRPQEILTVQVALSMVTTVNAIDRGPTTGREVDAVVLTGDLTDNAQRNELDWFGRIVEGGEIAPRSGSETESSWVGAIGTHRWDDRYWHPDGPPRGQEADRPTGLYGYPLIPGLVEAARRNVISPGLARRSIAVHGNHDGLLQGTVPPDAVTRAMAVGSERIVGLDPTFSPLQTAQAIEQTGPAKYPTTPSSPRLTIVPDTGRDLVGPTDFARALTGHDCNYFSTDVGEVRLISLDTVNLNGGWQGSLDEIQFDWLAGQLADAADRYVVIASHHPSPTLTNDYAPVGSGRRVLGAEVVELLLRHPHVIAWMAGHIHHHAALWHGDDVSGFWEFTTASIIDWPQQARIVELVRVSDRGCPEIAIVSTIVDHAAAADWGRDSLANPAGMAAVSRALSANDYRIRDGGAQGHIRDSTTTARNAVWRLPDPLAGPATRA